MAEQTGKTYTCENCGCVFESGWSDEEAEAESQYLFGSLAPENRAVVCDDCFQQMMAWAKFHG